MENLNNEQKILEDIHEKKSESLKTESLLRLTFKKYAKL
jgi:hypothetical protein